MAPQEARRVAPDFAPQSPHQFQSAFGIQISRPQRQPQTESERYAEVQQPRGGETEHRPARVRPRHGTIPRERTHVVSQRGAGQRDVAHFDRDSGEDADEGDEAEQHAEAEIARHSAQMMLHPFTEALRHPLSHRPAYGAVLGGWFPKSDPYPTTFL